MHSTRSSKRCTRGPHDDKLVHHSDRGTQYVSIRYTERLAEAGIERSVGNVGDSYDNAVAETLNGLYKTEVIRRRGPWRNVDDVEYATLVWVDWFNNRRLLGRSVTCRRPSSKRRTINNRVRRWRPDLSWGLALTGAASEIPHEELLLVRDRDQRSVK